VPETTGFRVRGVFRGRRAGPDGPATPATPPPPPGAPRTTIEWAPPCQVLYRFGGNGGQNMLTYTVPTTPGRARLFFSILRAR
jgi:hypothetical protein